MLDSKKLPYFWSKVYRLVKKKFKQTKKYLIFRIILYLFIFRLKIDPFLKTNYNQDIKYLGGREPIHNCFSNAFEIRTEVEMLRKDFNSRFKQIIFTSVLNAYYATFIPFWWVFIDDWLSCYRLFMIINFLSQLRKQTSLLQQFLDNPTPFVHVD
jgi:hypothetical protein